MHNFSNQLWHEPYVLFVLHDFTASSDNEMHDRGGLTPKNYCGALQFGNIRLKTPLKIKQNL